MPANFSIRRMAGRDSGRPVELGHLGSEVCVNGLEGASTANLGAEVFNIEVILVGCPHAVVMCPMVAHPNLLARLGLILLIGLHDLSTKDAILAVDWMSLFSCLRNKVSQQKEGLSGIPA